MALGARIKEARREHLSLTQRALAIKLGVDQVTLSRWEREESEPRARHLRALADLAELPVSWFYEEETEAVA